MAKTISRARLRELQEEGAQVEPIERPPAPPPDPVQPINDMSARVTRSIDAMAAAQGKTVEQMQVIVDQNRDLIDRINAQLIRPQDPPIVVAPDAEPITYDFVMTRDSDNLLTNVRAIPVVDE